MRGSECSPFLFVLQDLLSSDGGDKSEQHIGDQFKVAYMRSVGILNGALEVSLHSIQVLLRCGLW